jgi:NTE family protein
MLTTYAYDPASDLTQTTLPAGNGYLETRSYDAAGRLTEVKNAKGASVLSDYVSTLDPVGNPTQIIQSAAPAATQTYIYDANDRLWRFSKPYAWDYRVGEIQQPRTPIASAIAASAAFPPFLSPLSLKVHELDFVPGSGEDLQQSAYRTRAVLSDGGVYDNLGLQTAWSYRTLLVSDGAGHMASQERPHAFWPLQFPRVLKVINNQVRSLRKRQLIDGYKAGLRHVAYREIRSDISRYQLPDALPAPYGATIKLVEIPARLEGQEAVVQEQLINWGYAVCDAGLRKHVDSAFPAPPGFPYPSAGVG